MTERTYNIIMACKNRKRYANCIESVREYIAKECMDPIHYYDENTMSRIMKEAMYDYIDTCDRPSAFFRSMETIFGYENFSVGEKIGRAFVLVRVRNNDKYVNGFGEWENDA